MSNEETGKLCDLVADSLIDCTMCSRDEAEEAAAAIVGAVESRYKIEPLENTVEEEAA